MFSIKKLQPYIKQFWERADITMLIICVICSIFGTVMIYRASSSMVAAGWEMNTNKQIIVQVFSMFLGIGAYVLLTVIDADLLAGQWKFLIGIQPSEIIKIIYIIVAATQMTWLKEYRDINSFPSVAMMAGHFVLVFGAIVVVSSDLGSASIILCIFLTMFFALGVRLYWFALGGAAISAMVPLLWEYFLKPYQKNRLLAPYDASIDPKNDGINWQTYQSKITLASGRTTGVDAEHRYTAFTGKHTDFIFSCIGEELGMIGCIIVLILLTILIIRCVRIGLKAGRTFDMLLCIGVASAMTFQMFINIGMCLGITPVIGITLPFFSYGGSSMVTMFAALGLVSGVKYKLKPKLFSIY